MSRGAPLAEVAAFLDEYLDVAGTPDYPGALNGLQVEAAGPVERVAAAVDASTAVIREAADAGADLLVVHHGLFWGGPQPLTGYRYERIRTLVESGTALYSAHLPLDAHAEVGNAAVLARRLGFEALEPFGRYEGANVGWKGAVSLSADALADRLAGATGGAVQVLPGGPGTIAGAGVVTGAGASALGEAAACGLDALVTGEAAHHHAVEAAELGVTVLLGGHYATETWGVKAVAGLLRDRFPVETWFVDSPTGL